MIEEAIKKIDEDRIYNLSNIRDNRLFPWTDDVRMVRKIVMADHKNENLMKSRITGAGRALEYRIKGKNLIEFLKKYGAGLMF